MSQLSEKCHSVQICLLNALCYELADVKEQCEFLKFFMTFGKAANKNTEVLRIALDMIFLVFEWFIHYKNDDMIIL